MISFFRYYGRFPESPPYCGGRFCVPQLGSPKVIWRRAAGQTKCNSDDLWQKQELDVPHPTNNSWAPTLEPGLGRSSLVSTWWPDLHLWGPTGLRRTGFVLLRFHHLWQTHTGQVLCYLVSSQKRGPWHTDPHLLKLAQWTIMKIYIL